MTDFQELKTTIQRFSKCKVGRA